MALSQQQPQLAIVQHRVLPRGLGQRSGQQFGVIGQVAAMFVLIGFGRRQRGRDHLLHPVRKPALKADVDRQSGKQRNQHRRHQRNGGKDPHKPHVQA